MCRRRPDRRPPQRRRLLWLTVGAALLCLAFLGGPFFSGVVAVRAATTTHPHPDRPSTEGTKNAEYVFHSLEELNRHVHGAPYSFRALGTSTTAAEREDRGSSNDEGNDKHGPAEANEMAEALELYTASASSVFRTLPAPDAAVNFNAVSYSQESAEVNLSAASMCAADFTCPRSSVAWASGSFAATGLLTPHSLTLPIGLELRLSLCCQYRFDGSLLRSRELYDVFLKELLQASPFQVLSAAEKRELFPQHRIYVVDTWDRRRAYNTSYTPTEDDAATHNDGDGDVLVLTTGFLTPAALQKVLSSSAALADISSSGSSTGGNSGASAHDAAADGVTQDNLEKHGGSAVEAVEFSPGTDMQLRVTNRILKCKCPHILRVMPLLHVRPDALPPIAILGLGSHCGVPPRPSGQTRSSRATGAAASSRPRIHQVRRADSTTVFAASFELTPRLPPTTLVSWTVRPVGEPEGNERGTEEGASSGAPAAAVLRHTRLLPVVLNASGHVQYSSSASPFFLVQPNVRYEVSVTVSRGPMSSFTSFQTADNQGEADREDGTAERSAGRGSAARPWSAAPRQGWRHLHITRSSRGRLVLRLPFNRSWALPPTHPTPHFGFRRSMKLSNTTLSHVEVAAALHPQLHPSTLSSSPTYSSAVVTESKDEPNSGGTGWFGLGRWTGSGAATTTTTTTHHRTLSYYGYWENAPLPDQLLSQHAVHVSSNPFTDPSPAGVAVPLFVGRNLVAYVVRDVDDVCEPVVLEGREIWAVQSIIETPGPLTACTERTDVAALVLRELYLRMRSEPKIDVTVPSTTWSTDRTRPAEVAAEGSYRCDAVDKDAGASASRCAAVPDRERDGSECFAALQMNHRGVYETVWVVRVAVRDARLAIPENLDPLYARVVQASDLAAASSSAAAATPDAATAAVAVVEVRSHPLLIVRRQASYPAVVKIELPMHARRWLITAPASSSFSSSLRRAKGGGGGGSSGPQTPDVLLDNAPTGYWRSRPPIHVLSVDERRTAELDTNDVPNVQRTLPNGTLEFVAQDNGEVLALSTKTHGEVRAFAYTAKCPDTLVEYELHVVAFPPLPITPAYAPVYTEEGCVVLVPPRAVRKDEVAEWHVPPCAAAAAGTGAAGRGPYLIERMLSVEEQEEHAYVTTVSDGGEPLLSPTQSRDTSAQNRTLEAAAAAASTASTVARRPVTALMACGVEVYRRCDVVWSVHNLVAAVQKTYSLRRCQRPPAVLFHANDRQRRVSYPQRGVFQLPTVRETVYVEVNATPGTTGTASGTASRTVVRVSRPREIIPIAGYHSTLGYSFNYTGAQEHFGMHLHPLPSAAAHQLMSTQHDYVAAEDGVLVLRRRTGMDMQQPQQNPPATTWQAESGVEDANANSFWSEYEANSATPFTRRASGRAYNPAASATTMTSSETEARAQQQERSRRMDQRLEETYIIEHERHARRLRVAAVGNSSLFPMDYAVRGSSAAAVRSAAAAEDEREFARRGMCVERPGYIAVLAVNPRGSVREDERYGTVLPAPAAPAVAVLPFCAPQYTFARYPELSSVYGYEYTWTCPAGETMTVTKYQPTYSVLTHTPERRGSGSATASADVGAEAQNETLCELAVVNHITKTEQRDWFLVRRVYPSPLPVTSLVVLSDNAADSLQITATASPAAMRLRGPQSRNGATPRASTSSSNSTATVITMEELYSAPANTYPFTKARRVVGKSVVLHVDAPSAIGKARWAVESIVPATTITVGTQVLMSEVEFHHLHRHPAAVARGRGGATVLVKGLRTPGLYTLSHTLPDPENPSVCPPVILTEMLDVFHARVLAKELFVCGDTAALQAVPLPREIAHEFVGQWEVVSHATDDNTVWTAGVNFTGIRFERGARAETLVHGLPFGVITMRWAIYRLLSSTSNNNNAAPLSDLSAMRRNKQAYPTGGHSSGAATAEAAAAQQRVLVDYDTVEVFVLTENLPSHRLVTLADEATIFTSSSTQNWKLEGVVSGLSDGGVASTRVRLSQGIVANYSQSTVNPFADAVGNDEVQRAMFHTYYGLHPRLGSGALTLQHLPVGTVHLRYDVVPSLSVFGKMIGHTCALQGYYDVERVSAYLTATTSLDHECDGYTGQGRITLCLHTEGTGIAGAGTAAAPRSSAKKQGRGARAPTQLDALFWQSQVRLVAPETLEDTIKRGAREVEQLSGGRCATPWWVAPSTQWLNPSYTSSLTGPTASGSAVLPGRCVSFGVKASRHLSPREAGQPLFLAVPRAFTSVGGGAVSARMDREGSRRRTSSSSSSSGACPFHGDFISTRVIDGSPLVEGGTALKSSSTAARPSSTASVGSLFGFTQLFQLGLPHMTGRSEGRKGGSGSSDSDGDGSAWGIRYLPVLQPSSLRRANATMRPMVGLRGVLDDVTTELSISGPGHAWRFGEPRDEDGEERAAATVLLRLDLTNAKHFGGYTVFTADQAVPAQAASSSSSVPTAAPPPPPQPLSVPHQSLLYRCVAGTVRGADVLQYWSETNRPDGRVDRTAQEWLDYAYAVRDAPAACDVLFTSLDHLVSDAYGPSFSAPQHTSNPNNNNGGGGGRRRVFSSKPTPHQQQQQRHPKPQYVSLTEMEQQVERLRKQYRWTADGIDVTGLPTDVQSALSHRRVTTTQLRAIEASRRARQAAEEAQKQQQQRQQQRELENAPSHMSPMERLTAALRAYRGVAQGGEVAVLRIRLPLHDAFTVPYDLFLRTALHKDVLCGTAVDPPPALRNPTAPPTVMNPYSLVPLGRLEIRDVAPALSLYPPVMKQCEVEGGPPVLTFELTGAIFAHDRFSADEVLLEEVPNPDLVKLGRNQQQHPEVGLTACVAEMRRGLNAVVEAGSRKRLYLQLGACPFFKMLTPEEYNEHQDSEALLRRLQFPRFLRVTVRRAIRPDSHLSGSASTAGRRDGPRPALQNLSSSASSTVTVVAPTSTDASFLVEVRPTLARLHLRSSADMDPPPDTRPTAGSWRQRGDGGRRQDSVKRVSGSSWWSRSTATSHEDPPQAAMGGGGATTATTAAPTSTAAADDDASAFSFAPTPARPLVLCEADLHRYGFQLGIELIGDTWTQPVGEEGASTTTAVASSAVSSSTRHTVLPRQRAPPNVALINSFSVVEHHSLDSSHHLYLKGGGVYRSHFMNYLFTTLLSDPAVLRDHAFVHRYNRTFVSIVVPPLSAVSARRGGLLSSGLTNGMVDDEEDADFYAAQQQQQRRRYGPANGDDASTASAPVGAVLPAVRQFCKVEEVLFAVPGIATECRGCLLADTTFFVAGDLTGAWTLPTSAAPSAAPGRWWSSETFTRPLVVPWDSVGSIPREWVFEWVCPTAAHRALERWALQFRRSDVSALSIVMDVVLYRVRGLQGEELPAPQRPTVLLSSQPFPLADILAHNRVVHRSTASHASSAGSGFFEPSVAAAPLRLRVADSAAGAAYTRLTDDVLRHRRHAWTTMEYHRDDRDADGLLVVNASVFLKVCAGGGGGAGPAACTVVSIADSLLTVEPPRAAAPQWASWPRRMFGLGSQAATAERSTALRASPLSPFVLLHHAFMTYLCYELIPLLGIVTLKENTGGGSRGSASTSESFTADQQRAHVAYTAMTLVFLFFSYAYVPVVWVMLCLTIWSLSLYCSRRPELVVLLVGSVLYSHYLM
ncbi:putative mitochondrial hypothetical protein [Leptomonas pyrrhocoris]|uniref:Uncharacterized protein n=1 Tax=Leptomonas pyrrhocoris TaxID=157538 RepID=A0A0M9FUI1_LEPPY|nr:putative mitochondrial hypothetical protein [Leptomonas pyrrhocoris]KPA76136.1 putative mitochondrial hypothetical protein [Leptomonas pyrrhocoris]|eukprot:XP_015654575.1 putative mitochondrial hypothetical protein [Leptomonas pyrrhocoris]